MPNLVRNVTAINQREKELVLNLKHKVASEFLMEYVYSDWIDFSGFKGDNISDILAAVMDLSNFAIHNDMSRLFTYLATYLLKQLTIPALALLTSYFKDVKDNLKQA